MALKSESASQMDHLQALEKVSPKLASREGRYSLLYVLKSPSLFEIKKIILMK